MNWEQIEATAAAGKAALEAAQERHAAAWAEREAERAAQKAENWREALDAIRAAMPEWAHEYMQEPLDREPVCRSDYAVHVRPVFVQLPDAAPIYAYYNSIRGEVCFFAAENYRVVRGDVDVDPPYQVMHDGGGLWERSDLHYHPDRWAVAVYLARLNCAAMREAEAEAVRKNAKSAAPQRQPEPPKLKAPTALEAMQFSFGAFSTSGPGDPAYDDWLEQLTIYAAVAQAEALHRIAELLEQTSRPTSSGRRYWATDAPSDNI